MKTQVIPGYPSRCWDSSQFCADVERVDIPVRAKTSQSRQNYQSAHS